MQYSYSNQPYKTRIHIIKKSGYLIARSQLYIINRDIGLKFQSGVLQNSLLFYFLFPFLLISDIFLSVWFCFFIRRDNEIDKHGLIKRNELLWQQLRDNTVISLFIYTIDRI
jgi:hypothetical protein